MRIQESGEMYLETIYLLCRTRSDVRAVDVAAETGYSKPSVSRALAILKNNRYAEVDENGFITLTDSGEELARNVYERHCALTEFLTGIGVDRETAAHDACKIEHVISAETLEKIKEYNKKSKTMRSSVM